MDKHETFQFTSYSASDNWMYACMYKFIVGDLSLIDIPKSLG